MTLHCFQISDQCPISPCYELMTSGPLAHFILLKSLQTPGTLFKKEKNIQFWFSPLNQGSTYFFHFQSLFFLVLKWLGTPGILFKKKYKIFFSICSPSDYCCQLACAVSSYNSKTLQWICLKLSKIIVLVDSLKGVL